MEESNAHQRFTELNVWKYARALKIEVYSLTQAFPAHEKFGLTSQLIRSHGQYAVIYLKSTVDLLIKTNFIFASNQEAHYLKRSTILLIHMIAIISAQIYSSSLKKKSQQLKSC